MSSRPWRKNKPKEPLPEVPLRYLPVLCFQDKTNGNKYLFFAAARSGKFYYFSIMSERNRDVYADETMPKLIDALPKLKTLGPQLRLRDVPGDVRRTYRRCQDYLKGRLVL